MDITQLPYRPCVGMVLQNKDGLVFTGERLDTPGAWQMPQGGIDGGEDPLRAAYREIKEETGIPADALSLRTQTQDWLTYDLPKELIGKAFKGRYRGQKQRWFLFELEASDSVIDIKQKVPEFSRWRWSTPEETLADIVAFKRDLYKQVFKSLGLTRIGSA